MAKNVTTRLLPARPSCHTLAPSAKGFSTLHDIDVFRCSVAEISDNLAGYIRYICLNVKILR